MIERAIRVTVNRRPYGATVEARKTLADFLRDDLELRARTSVTAQLAQACDRALIRWK